MNYMAIADVGETIIELLKERMADMIPPDSIALTSPGEIEATDAVRLSLFLYQVVENAHLKNQEMELVNTSKLRYPPLTLDLSYLLTSYPSSGIQDKTEKTKEAHSILGKALWIFHDNPILKGSVLRGSLAENNEELHISQTLLNLDDMTKIWSTFQDTPFRPSICYLVTPVRIGSDRETRADRVLERRFK